MEEEAYSVFVIVATRVYDSAEDNLVVCRTETRIQKVSMTADFREVPKEMRRRICVMFDPLTHVNKTVFVVVVYCEEGENKEIKVTDIPIIANVVQTKEEGEYIKKEIEGGGYKSVLGRHQRFLRVQLVQSVLHQSP